LDTRHGTERVVIEQMRRFPLPPAVETHIYSERVEDLNGVTLWPSSEKDTRFYWHKTPELPGPHILKFCFWLCANRLARWRDAHFRGLRPDLVFSPCINAFDADVIAVHIVFTEFHRRVAPQLKLRLANWREWPLLLHRRLYYRLIMALERIVYRPGGARLAPVSFLVANQLREHFGCHDVNVIHNSVDCGSFNVAVREARREAERRRLGIAPNEIAVLLIGNDWKNKGLDALLRAAAECADLPLRIVAAGQDSRELYSALIAGLGLENKVIFCRHSPDVMAFYAAADIYAGPSLEDAFPLPMIESMACGLPVILSARAGTSEILTDNVDGLLLRNPEDVPELAGYIRRLATDPELRARFGAAAAQTAKKYTWDKNAAQLWQIFEECLAARAAR
jgi:UDP-glucose:(heptosyl)LPS alpha-1,3-glucosyltransferase